jgi:hypothetical protein
VAPRETEAKPRPYTDGKTAETFGRPTKSSPGCSDGSDAEGLRKQRGNIGRKGRRKPDRKPRRGERRKRFEASGLFGIKCPARLACCPRQYGSGPPRSGKLKLLRELKQTGLDDRREARMPLPARAEHAAETRPKCPSGPKSRSPVTRGLAAMPAPFCCPAAIDPIRLNVSPFGTPELYAWADVPRLMRVLAGFMDKLAPRAPVASPCLITCAARVFPIHGQSARVTPQPGFAKLR